MNLTKTRRKFVELHEFDESSSKINRKFDEISTKIRQNKNRAQTWPPDGSQDPLSQCPPPLVDYFWVPSGTPKSTKNATSAENWTTEAGFLVFFLAFLFSPAFWLIFGRFWSKDRWQTHVVFSVFLVVFSIWRTFKFIDRYGVWAISIFQFSLKDSKNEQKIL